MTKTFSGIAAALFVAAVMWGCGSSGGTTTVIKEVRAPAARQSAAAPKPEPGPSGSPPNVVGLSLDVAEKQLEEAGYEADPTNTDTSFGIVLPEHFTVCTQDDPRGTVVHVLAQKYGC